MEAQFFCGDCGSQHTEPAEAYLGHLVICLDCSMRREFDGAEPAFVVVSPPIAA